MGWVTADEQGATNAAGKRLRAAVIFNPTKQGVETLRSAIAAAEARQHFAPSLWIETAATAARSASTPCLVGLKITAARGRPPAASVAPCSSAVTQPTVLHQGRNSP